MHALQPRPRCQACRDPPGIGAVSLIVAGPRDATVCVSGFRRCSDRSPQVAVIHNVDVSINSDPATIRETLARQAAGAVLWSDDHAHGLRSRRDPCDRMRPGARVVRSDQTYCSDLESLAITMPRRLPTYDLAVVTTMNTVVFTATVLAGEVALVTGASRGIGRAIADHLARGGAVIVGTATSESGADRSRTDCRNDAKGRGAVLDVRDAAAVEALIDGSPTITANSPMLVNNAGITRDTLAMRMKDDDWSAVMDTNLSAVFRLSRSVLRGMMKARHGRIINISSVVGASGNAGQANYAAAKAGLQE